MADAGVVEALRHIHDNATIWVRQQHARLTLNAIERDQLGARPAAAPRRGPAGRRAPVARTGTSRGADATASGRGGPARQEAAAEKAARSLLAEEENNAKKKKAKAPVPKKKKGKKGPPGRRARVRGPCGASAVSAAPGARSLRPRLRLPAPAPAPPPRAAPTPAPAPAPRAEPPRKAPAKAEAPAVAVKPPAPTPAPVPPPGLTQARAAAPAATEAEAAMRAFVRELGLSEDHAPWLLTESCQSPEALKHVSIEAMVRLGLPPRAAATIRAAVGAPPPEEYFCSISVRAHGRPVFRGRWTFL